MCFISFFFECTDACTLHTISDITKSSVRLNQRGTRLLCREVQAIVCCNVIPSKQQEIMGGGSGNVQLFSAPGYVIHMFGRNNHCFVGCDEELVVAASIDHGLFVWPFPIDGQVADDKGVIQSLIALRSHNKDNIYSFRYNRQSDTLASASAEKRIKLWTLIAQQQ